MPQKPQIFLSDIITQPLSMNATPAEVQQWAQSLTREINQMLARQSGHINSLEQRLEALEQKH